MPIRPNHTVTDYETYCFWKKNHITEKIYDAKKDKPAYILHDGPPYANGEIHLGHAYNKIMKDIIIRSRGMMGYNTYTIPGWDCHGLPIEHKVAQANPTLDSIEIKKQCELYAEGWINNQRESFKKLGILMDWENPYKTMDKKYQSTIISVFGTLVSRGYISRSKKTVPWCCGCKTALASAEIEYKNSKDPSLYVLFEAKKNNFLSSLTTKEVFFIIWTTTPWTLPLNRAVMLKKNGKYMLAFDGERHLIFGKDCLTHLAALTKKEFEILYEFDAEKLKNEQIFHPFEENRVVPVIFDDAVETGEGTACVHTAPGCGPTDYEVGIKNNLEIYSPVSDNGLYTPQTNVPELIGMPISEGQIWVIKKLAEKGTLFFKTNITHSYPHCWRSLEKLIFRATPQWFCNLEKDNFKEKTLKAIDTITFFPESGKSTLKATVSNRWEWCISRQRKWGVPIVALINKESNTYWTSEAFIEYIANKVAVHGIEYWDRLDLKDKEIHHLIPQKIIDQLNQWNKETDILDVWFDSGISHTEVLKKNNMFPADVYLEGVDQHRGWFQSSLLTSVALYDQAPMKTIVSCGYTVDEKGQKMSKSQGNGVDPESISKKIGLDCLRMWVASVQIGGDIVVSEKVFSNIQEVYRKIRNTCRFAIQNISDFDPFTEIINFNSMDFVNQYAVEILYEYAIKIISAYQNFNFSEVLKLLIDLCNSFLSSFYFDIHKDILYCEGKYSFSRKQVQSVLYVAVDMIVKLIAPICIVTAEDISNYYVSSKKETIHLELFPDFTILKESTGILRGLSNYSVLTKEIIQTELTKIKENDISERRKLWKDLFELRNMIFKKIEELREEQIVKQSIETEVIIFYTENSKIERILKELKRLTSNEIEEFLALFLLVSNVKSLPGNEESVDVRKYNGKKCDRCWKYTALLDEIYPVCTRCAKIVKKLEMK